MLEEEEESPNREIGTLARIDPDMFLDNHDDSIVLIMDVCPDSEACQYFEQGPMDSVNHCYVHSETGLEWTDYISDGTLLARVLHPIQGQVWIPQAWLVSIPDLSMGELVPVPLACE